MTIQQLVETIDEKCLKKLGIYLIIVFEAYIMFWNKDWIKAGMKNISIIVTV